MLLTNLRPTAELFELSPEVTENNSLIPASGELQARFADLMRAPLTAELPPAEADKDNPVLPPGLPGDRALPPGGNALPLARDLGAGTDGWQTSDDALLAETAPADSETGADSDTRLVIAASDIADSTGDEITAYALANGAEAARQARVKDSALVDPLAPATSERGVTNAANRGVAAIDLRRSLQQGLPSTAADTAFEQATSRNQGPQWQEIRGRNPVDRELPVQAQAPRGTGEPAGGPLTRALPVEGPAVNFAAQMADSAGDKPEILPKHTLESIAPSQGTAAIDTAAARESASTILRSTPLQTTIPLALGDDGWGEAFGERVTWLSRGGIQSAELKLHPAELGPIRVQVAVEDDAAKLTFTAPHAVTREAIEQALPRLREMLSESGLTLAGTDINDTSTREDQAARRDAAGEGDQLSLEEGDLAAEAEALPLPKKPSGLVDTFA